MEISTVGSAWDWNYYSNKVNCSNPVRGNFFAVLFLLQYNSGRSDRMIYLWENLIMSQIVVALVNRKLSDRPVN